MSDVTLSVENVSKSFKIAHAQRAQRYRTLRDDIMGFPRRLLARFSKRDGSSSEIFWALKDISFQVKEGEVLGVIGRNGAGKSTLLKILSRITDPTAGVVNIYGRVGSLLEVGTGFHHELTGRENIFMNGAILGMSRTEIKDKFDEIVAFSEIEKFLDTPVKHFSSGMYVRLAFAVAAHLDPEILLVDEVLAVGDSEFQKKCLGKMEDVASKEGRTVLFVSHNIDAIYQLCTRCILLRDGEIAFAGKTADAIAAYAGADQNSTPEVDFKLIDSDAAFRSAGLYDPQDRAQLTFGPDTPLRVRCSFVVRRLIPGLQVSLFVLNSKGQHIFRSAMSLADRTLNAETGGVHFICAVVPGRLLLPGRYFVSLKLNVPNVALYDAREQCLSFEIIGTSDGFYAFGSKEEWGQVNVDVKWERDEDRYVLPSGVDDRSPIRYGHS